MSDTASYEKRKYFNVSIGEIEERIEALGFDPLMITDPPGRVYRPHAHAQTKLLVFLDGEMWVRAGEHEFECGPGDELIIPGGMEHEARVGETGCVFYWAERVM